MRIVISLILISQSLWAAKEDIQITKINLQEYLKSSLEKFEVEKMDMDGDGKIDAYVVFDKRGKNRSLVMHLFDLNADGKIDRVKHFSKGKMIRVEADLDFDGKVDTVSEYDPKTGKLNRKLLSDGKSLIWKFWHNGELRRKEIDRNNDGVADMWVHYRGGQKIRTEIDVDFTGKNIRVEKSK